MKAANKKIKVLYLMTSCRRCGPTQQTLNIIKNLDRNIFEPILVTIYEEPNDSRLGDFISYVSKHDKIIMKKWEVLLGKDKRIREYIEAERPDIIHTIGVFPDYLIAKMGFSNHVFTLRNYLYDDYLDKFGKVRGSILAKMQIAAIKRTRSVVTCSQSLEMMYRERLGISTHCIQNGVDAKKYSPISKDEKKRLRRKLGFSQKDFIWIYSGQFIGRKNIPFMIDGFLKRDTKDKNEKLVLLGDGDDYEAIRENYKWAENVIFVGDVKNVVEYLNAGDVYVSASKSEGLPNSVLEAMACGLPVLLSDIPQHKELLIDGTKGGGITFRLDSMNDYIDRMNEIRQADVTLIGQNAHVSVISNFDSKEVSKQYQELYKKTMHPKRISLFISGLSGGGAERVTVNLANYLYKVGYQVDVITMSNKNDTYVLDKGVKRICLLDEGERTNRLQNFLVRDKRLKRYIINNKDIECYIAMLPITIFMLMRFKKFTKSRVIISERIDPKSYSLIKKIMMKHSAKKCDGLVVQTKEIGDWYNFVKDKTVIPNAINDDVDVSRRGRIERKIVAVGRLEKQKNYPMLIEGFSLFSTKHPEYKLEIYGQGSQESLLRRIVAERNLDKKILFKGYTKNIAKNVSTAACFITTSNYEGMPNALIEAMCMGVPCIATDSDGGGARELIDNFKNGILIKKGAIDELVAGLERIASDNDFSEKIGNNAKKMNQDLAPGRIYGMWNNYITEVMDRS